MGKDLVETGTKREKNGAAVAGWMQHSRKHWFFTLFFVYFSRLKSSNQLSFEDFFFSLYHSTAGTWRNWQTR